MFFILIVFLANSIVVQSDVILFNGRFDRFAPHYQIRDRRDLPEIDKTRISCQPDIYEKLLFCSRLIDCPSIDRCFQLIHCPLNVKSYGSLIYNLLQLLGINHCSINDHQSTCSHQQRLALLKRFLSQWRNNKDKHFCTTVPMFIDEVKRNIQEECPMHSRQVSDFLENYICFPPPMSTTTTRSLPLSFFDEDENFQFIDQEKNLVNDTDQSVFVNDHQYYNVSYIIPNFIGTPRFFVDDRNPFIPIHPLSNRHRSAFGVTLKFTFPFYGHLINRILVATGGNHFVSRSLHPQDLSFMDSLDLIDSLTSLSFPLGFIYTGDLLHSALIGSTQYIAPFMANFDASIGGNQTEIKYFDNTTHFVCTWKKIYLQDQRDIGPFTFQVILHNSGRILFNYIEIPSTEISSLHHAHRIGVSDAYLSQHLTNEHIVRVVTLYDKINLDVEKIKTGVSVLLEMDQTCNTFIDCSSCLANRGKRYNCSWCDEIQKCSDGYDRSRQQWIRSQCHRLAADEVCPNSIESHFPTSTTSVSPIGRALVSYRTSNRSNTLVQTFRTIIVTLLISVLILALLAFGVTYVYAYRNPTSAPGMWLLEHRPSTYIARFKNFTSGN